MTLKRLYQAPGMFQGINPDEHRVRCLGIVAHKQGIDSAQGSAREGVTVLPICPV
jgi:hypothetical protein